MDKSDELQVINEMLESESEETLQQVKNLILFLFGTQANILDGQVSFEKATKYNHAIMCE